MLPKCDIVIATRHRPEAVRDCLHSINVQSVLPCQVVVVNSSGSSETKNLVDSLSTVLEYPCVYRHTLIPSAAQQRNLGADLCTAEVILFLDDDVILETAFILEILSIFDSGGATVAGVSGTISNQVYSDPKGLNRLLLGLCLGRLRGSYAGKVIGPSVNFLPADRPDTVQPVEWLPTTCTAFRRDIFMAYRFENTFEGYSFAEDVHLSTRIAQNYQLMNTTRARVFHSDLGKDTHRDWTALGESQVKNRHLVMTSVLGRTGLIVNLRLFAYEMIYCSLTWLAAGISASRITRLYALLGGKLAGFRKVWSGPALAPLKKVHEGED